MDYGFESTPGARSWSGGDVCSAGVSHNRRTTPHKLCHASRAAPQITDRSQGSRDLEAYFGLVGHWSVTTCLTCSRFSFWQSSTKCDHNLWLICLAIRNVTINWHGKVTVQRRTEKANKFPLRIFQLIPDKCDYFQEKISIHPKQNWRKGGEMLILSMPLSMINDRYDHWS